MIFLIPALAGFQRRYAVGEKEHVSDSCLLLLLLPSHKTLEQKARDPERLGVFYKFKSLLLMFLMRLKHGTSREVAYLKIWLRKTVQGCARMRL